MPNLRNGDDSPWVSELQQALKDRGFYQRAVDGNFGNGTESAVRAFQTSAALPVTGQGDETTCRALLLDHLIGPVPAWNAQSAALLFPGTRFRNIENNLPFVVSGLIASGLTDKRMFLMALATIRAETSAFLPISEGQSRFNTSEGGEPFDLYDNRRDLGNEGPPDGDRYKGRGYIQLTGRSNYADIGRRIGLGNALVDAPDRANDPDVAGQILAEFLKRSEARVRAALDLKDLAAARRCVNGGSHGLDAFSKAYLRGEEVYADSLRLS